MLSPSQSGPLPTRGIHAPQGGVLQDGSFYIHRCAGQCCRPPYLTASRFFAAPYRGIGFPYAENRNGIGCLRISGLFFNR